MLTRVDPGWRASGQLACFDLDCTLVFPCRGYLDKYPLLMPGTEQLLAKLHQQGFAIAVFTNQLFMGEQRVTSYLDRFQSMVSTPLFQLASLARDSCRKPETNMWHYLLSMLDGMSVDSSSFYCGDAAGRPGDFSDCDRQFAANCGLAFLTPNQLFADSVLKIPRGKPPLIITVGEPGCGKTYWVEHQLLPLGFSVDEASLTTGRPVVIDSVGYSLATRRKYYALAEQHGYQPIVVHFLRRGDQRTEPAVYRQLWKQLDIPDQTEPALLFRVR